MVEFLIHGSSEIEQVGSYIHVIPCDDTQVTIAEEYDTYGVTVWRPSCSDFVRSGGSEHFSWNELNGGFAQGNPHYNYGYAHQYLIRGLEHTRENYSRGGIRITSGYRCPHGNASVDGEEKSYHVRGRAADMYSLMYPWTEQEFALLRFAAQMSGPVELLDWTSYTDRHLHAAW